MRYNKLGAWAANDGKAAEIQRLIRNREQDLREFQEALSMQERLNCLNQKLLLSQYSEHRLKRENDSLRTQLSFLADTIGRDSSVQSAQFTSPLLVNGGGAYSPLLKADTTLDTRPKRLNLSVHNGPAEWQVARVERNGIQAMRAPGSPHAPLGDARSPSIHQNPIGRQTAPISPESPESGRPRLNAIDPFSPLYGLQHEDTASSPAAGPLAFRGSANRPPSLKEVLAEADRRIRGVRAMLPDAADAAAS
jgi:hypothetical protein